MTGRKPFKSRFRRAFLAVVAAVGMGTSGLVLDSLPKNPDTDTQKVSTFQTQSGQKGYNISPSDQFWKHTLGLKTGDQKDDALVAAAKAGDSWRAQALFEHGTSATTPAAEQALAIAAYRGDADVVKVMLKNGVDAGARESLALRAASANGNVAVMQQLINAGANVAAKDNEALVLAVGSGNTAAVGLILQQVQFLPDEDFLASAAMSAPAADVNTGNGLPLELAVIGGNTAMAQLLIDNGANVNAKDGVALGLAVLEGNGAMVQALIDRGADVNAGNGTALTVAVELNDTYMAQLLMQNKADPDLRGGQIRQAASDPVMQQILQGGSGGGGQSNIPDRFPGPGPLF